MLRILITALSIAVLSATAAFAQTGYTYQPSGLEFTSTMPAQPGETVQGLLQLPNGLVGLGDVYVQGIDQDAMFAYWAGTHGGQQYYYDSYIGYWRPGPVQYIHSTLDFKGETVEGWVRQFGPYIEDDYFFGADGVLYKRINVERNRRRGTNNRRQIIYTFFVNTETLERSDSDGMPYTIIGDMGVGLEVIQQHEEQYQENMATILEENPAFPMWRVEAYNAPQEVVVANGAPTKEDLNLMQLIEAELGPISVDASESTEGVGAESSASAGEAASAE